MMELVKLVTEPQGLVDDACFYSMSVTCDIFGCTHTTSILCMSKPPAFWARSRFSLGLPRSLGLPLFIVPGSAGSASSAGPCCDGLIPAISMLDPVMSAISMLNSARLCCEFLANSFILAASLLSVSVSFKKVSSKEESARWRVQ